MGVQIDVPFLINAAAIAVMIAGLFSVLGMRAKVRRGKVDSAWKVLTTLVVLFTIAYLGTPFFGILPAQSVRMVFAFVFLFGAVYVVLTLRVLQRVLDELP